MNQDAKRALDTIEILKRNSTYTYSDGIAIINNLMKRSFADGKQYMRDQQENAVDLWLLVDVRNNEVLLEHFYTRALAENWINDRREAYPTMGYYNYEPMLFKGAMDND